MAEYAYVVIILRDNTGFRVPPNAPNNAENLINSSVLSRIFLMLLDFRTRALPRASPAPFRINSHLRGREAMRIVSKLFIGIINSDLQQREKRKRKASSYAIK